MASTDSQQIIRRYGHLNEGSQAIPTADKPAFKKRYIARHVLADLARCPEGFEFQHQLDQQPPVVAILLSPPHMVAVCKEDGKWERRARDETVDGPQPYTSEWYAAYLLEKKLPSWFLTAGHVALLTNGTEAQSLGVTGTDLPRSREVPANYLAVRYPAPPQFPEMIGVDPNLDYAYELGEQEQLCVARYFPASNVNSRGRVILRAGGYLTLHHDMAASGCSLVGAQHLRWSRTAASRASYVVKRSNATPLFDLNTPIAGNRSALAAAKSMNGGLVNPTEHVSGIGAWEWLEANIDPPLARVVAFPQPADVASALLRGHLRVGRDLYAGPSVVWQPDVRFFDPAAEPIEPGRWEFCTDSSREKARDDFGGQDAFGLARNPDPQLHEIWQIRQYFRTMMTDNGSQHDPTADINLVWILAADGEDAEEDVEYNEDSTTNITGIQPSQTPALGTTGTVAPAEPDAGHGHDSTNGLAHDPLNHGENNQTASDGKAEYQTRMIKDKKITIDRARARPVVGNNPPQTHRLWVYTNGGKWSRYPETRSNRVDWTDKKSVEKVSKWRQQSFKRYGWEPTHRLVRDAYTNEQYDWIFGFIRENNGGRPLQGPINLANEFNKKFGENRTVKAMQALTDRLVKEYKENGGKLKDRSETGRAPSKSKSQAKGKGKKGEDDGEEGGEDEGEGEGDHDVEKGE